MKKLFLLAAVLFSIPVFSQSADERIGTLINRTGSVWKKTIRS